MLSSSVFFLGKLLLYPLYVSLNLLESLVYPCMLISVRWATRIDFLLPSFLLSFPESDMVTEKLLSSAQLSGG